MKKRVVVTILGIVIVASSMSFTACKSKGDVEKEKKEVKTAFEDYMKGISEKKYEESYDALSSESKKNMEKDAFVTRNTECYENMGADEIVVKVKDIKEDEKDENKYIVNYTTKMKTSAGDVEFDNNVKYEKKEKEKKWSLDWEDSVIYPDLKSDCKIVNEQGNETAKRGKILDKEGNVLAQTGEDGKREYPQGTSACWLTGYVADVTDELIEECKLDKNIYDSKDDTKLNKVGMQGAEEAFEEKLRGSAGCVISVKDSSDNVVKEIAKLEKKDGEDVKTTFDMNIQKILQNRVSAQSSTSAVCIDPTTGEVKGVANPANFDPSSGNDGGVKNQAREKMSPGSTMKPITSLIALTAGAIDKDTSFDHSDVEWKNEGVRVKTTDNYSGKPRTLVNAMTYSDNIYFARAAMATGAEKFEEGLKKLGFAEGDGIDPENKNKNLGVPSLEMRYRVSTYEHDDNKGVLSTNKQMLADTGFGQGQLLVNPLHMAMMYTAIVNDGKMVNLHIEQKDTSYFAEDICSKEDAELIEEGLKGVVQNGTGQNAKGAPVGVAGKTGTAELGDPQKNENGWFACYTYDTDKPLLIVVTINCRVMSDISHEAVKVAANIINDIY